MNTLHGTGVSPGIATGVLRFYHGAALPDTHRAAGTPDEEAARWNEAAQTADRELEELAKTASLDIGEEAAALLETHRLMLADTDFTEAIEARLKEGGCTAETAVHEAGKAFAAQFAAMDDAYMHARSADVKDITERLLRLLTNAGEPLQNATEAMVLAADDLSPSETIRLDQTKLRGLLLKNGSPDGHTAILARARGIPAIIGLGDALTSVLNGHSVILDGETGLVTVDPDEAAQHNLRQQERTQGDARRALEALRGMPDITQDGSPVRLYANITSPEDVDAVLENDARGIGLFRSEFLYLAREDYPSEDEQLAAYRSVLTRMKDKPVLIRTLDIGADKNIPYFHLAAEENPALGMRALRICLTRPALFKTQLRALYRASTHGRLSILFPMVTSLWEIRECKRLCAEVRAELTQENHPFDPLLPCGIMIETPAAVLLAPELAREVDFFSVGTNDLAQYTLAVDRQSTGELARFYDPHHPALLRMVQMAADAAHAAGIWIGVCGELAADTTLTEPFLRMGIDELSVSPRFVLPLRQAIRAAKRDRA